MSSAFRRVSMIAFALLVVLALRSVPQPTADNCSRVEGTVQRVYEAGTKDLVLELADSGARYYVNRGLEQGLDLDLLREQLVGETVELDYIRHWSPLDPLSSNRPIARMSWNGTELFNRFDAAAS